MKKLLATVAAITLVSATAVAAQDNSSNAPQMTYPTTGGVIFPLPNGTIVGNGTYVGDGWAVKGGGSTDGTNYGGNVGVYLGPTTPTTVTETGVGAPSPMQNPFNPGWIDPAPSFPEIQPLSGPLFNSQPPYKPVFSEFTY